MNDIDRREGQRIELPGSPPPLPKNDLNARREAAGFAAEADLSSQRVTNQLNEAIRDDSFSHNLHRVAVVAIWMIGIAAGAMFATLVVNYIVPNLWLTDEQAKRLQDFLFSGGLGAILGAAAKRKMR